MDNSNIKFGKCLSLILAALDIRSSTLARVLNIDASLVNRWLHGKRVPSYRSHYIDDISQFISVSILNSFQEKRLCEVLHSIDNTPPEAITLRDKVRKILLEAQGNSIEEKKAVQAANCRRTAANCNLANELVSEFLHTCSFSSADKIEAAGAEERMLGSSAALGTDTNLPYIINLSEQDKLITGSKNILSAILDLIEAAACSTCSSEAIIYISFNNDAGIFCQHHELVERWKSALYSALKKGWIIIFLLRLTNDLNRTMGFIRFMGPLLGTGNFKPFYFKKYDALSTGREIVIVPGIGALSCYSASPGSGIDCAFYFTNSSVIEVLTKHFINVKLISSQPLIKFFPPCRAFEFHNEIIESEKAGGRKCLYKDGLGALTLPTHLYGKYLKSRDPSPGDYAVRLEAYEKYAAMFHNNVKYYEHKNIYIKESVETLVSEGLYPQDSFFGRQKTRACPEDIIEHLNNVIRLLKQYDNYEIALVSKKHVRNHEKQCWSVKENHSVTIETWIDDNENAEQSLLIEEPTIVKSFGEYFLDLWENIAPVNRDKNEVIAWFESQIRKLSAQVDNGRSSSTNACRV